MLHRLGVVPLLLVSLAAASAVLGGDPATEPSRAEDAADSPESTAERRVAVLKDGRIVTGRITQNSRGCRIEKPTGVVLIPSDKVLLIGRSRREAYRKLRGRLPPDSVDAHMPLARWCLKHRMYDACRDEIRTVLELDRDHQPARNLLVKLQNILNPDPDRPVEPEPSARTPDGFRPTGTTSLGGLSRESARAFVQRIQPLLINSCGNASCHGRAADAPFRLENATIQGQRVLTERNLRTVLQFIDPEHPDQSPILSVLKGSHGSARPNETMFGGPRGPEQRRMLREWVFRIAGEHGRQPTAGKRRPDSGDSQKSPSAGAATSRRPSLPKPPTRDGKAGPSETGGDILKQVLHEERPDAFDPDLFNRKVHGRSD